MVVLESPMDQEGLVVIPADIRTRLGLKPHDRVAFVIVGNEVVLRSTDPGIRAVSGVVEPLNRPEDFRRLRERFEEAVAKDVMGETE